MVDVQLSLDVDIDAMWQYEAGENWRDEWTYGWDNVDEELFGPIGYTTPESYELRRYYLQDDTLAEHTMVEDYLIPGNHLRTQFDYGYYDLLSWNAFPPMEHQSVVIDESSLDKVVAYTHTNATKSRGQEGATNSNTMYDRSFNQPEDLYSAYDRNFHISNDMKDYDYYDPETHTYYLHTDMTLHPVTYIYLTQVRLHNNRGRIKGVSNSSDLDGMARVVELNNGVTNYELVAVEYDTRMKKDSIIKKTGEVVDVVGGKCVTFGIPNQNSYMIQKASDVNLESRHAMSVTLKFYTDYDSLFVFDVTDQVHRRWRGGVLTIDLDVDTIKIPTRPGGGGMNAVVEDFVEKEYEFEIK